MKIETIKKRKTESLLKYIARLDERYYEAVNRDNGIGFGYGMRAYTRLKHMAFPEDKIRTNFKNVISELKYRNYNLNQISVIWLKSYLN